MPESLTLRPTTRPVSSRQDDEIVRFPTAERYDLAVMAQDLDSLDQRILELLVQDGRRSASEIGRLISLSPGAAKRRIDRLEKSGFILGYTALLDHDKLGGHLEAFCELRFAPETQVDEIEHAVAGVHELVESFTLAGDPDALVRLRVTDVQHLKTVIDRIRRGRRGGAKITGTKTLIVLATSKGPAGS
jgi:Lrp/AsnC family leucine-responsive transcriptional regulator